MPRPSGLRVIPRAPNGFTIVGSVVSQRVRRRAQSTDLDLAQQECHRLEAALLGLCSEPLLPLQSRLTEIETRLGRIEFLLQLLTGKCGTAYRTAPRRGGR